MKVDGTAYFALDSNALPWEAAHQSAPAGPDLPQGYPRGVINPSHTHP